ncbi:MAG: hypothetical protein K6A23_14660 [Butyrivibrio sp.]|nr:hypothetical protein [Butyrivibrio sp.]
MLLDGEYNYVYIENIGDDFQEYYAELFVDPTEFEPNHIYSVINADGNDLKLQLLK